MSSTIKSANLLKDIRREVRVEEKVIWTGCPDPTVTLRRLRLLFYLAVPWTIAAVPFTRGGTVGLFATIAGIGLLFGPFVAAWQAHCTVYLLTDSRALVLSKWGWNKSFTSVELCQGETEVEILPIVGKAGAVLFVPGLPPRSRHTDYTGKFGFWDVPDATGLAQIISRTINERSNSLRKGSE